MKKTLLITLIGFNFGINAQVSDTEDKVGIGTPSPQAKLHIFDNSNLTEIFLGESASNNKAGIVKYIQGSATQIGRLQLGNWGDNLQTDGFNIVKGGNIGIGTETPSDLLHLKGSNPTLRLSSSTYYGGNGNALNTILNTIKFSNHDDNHNYRAEIRGLLTGNWATSVGLSFTTYSEGKQIERMRINHNGNIGIGTEAPSDLLHLKGSNPTLRLSSSTYYGGNGNALNTILNTIKFSNHDSNHNYRAEIRGLLTGNWATSVGLSFTTNSEGKQVERMRINHNGNIGIGTKETGTHKLAVEGSIGAREIKVEVNNWSDFVFEKNYNLPTLMEVENHIKKNGHLKDIPSSKEVIKNGIFLGKMDAKLLQKIEELTLYTIEQENKIKSLEKENESFKLLVTKFFELQKRLEKLEKK